VAGNCIGQTPAALAELAQQYNSTIRGWMNYYEAFYRTEMQKLYQYLDQKLMQWARRKYKTLRQRKLRSAE
jgi:RNA-directed DNA polymerase